MKALQELAASILAGLSMGLFLLALIASGEAYKRHQEQKQAILTEQVLPNEKSIYITSEGEYIDFIQPEFKFDSDLFSK